MSNKLETLIEQTTFLIEKQKESQKDCALIFEGLLTAVKDKVTTSKSQPEAMATLEHVHSLIAEQAQRINEEAQVDIDFLTEQLQALNDIKKVQNPEKASELLAMLIDENEEIKETASFKEAVGSESQIAKQNLTTMVNDIKDAIREGSAQDVALYLESLLSEEETEDEELDDDDDDEEDEEDGCDDCHSCSSKGCCGGVDIFSQSINQENSKDKKIKH